MNFSRNILLTLTSKIEKGPLKTTTTAQKKKIFPFVTKYHTALPNLKNILLGKMAPYSKSIEPERNFHEPPTLSYHKGKSQKDSLLRAKL